jgi:hypothetical protein
LLVRLIYASRVTAAMNTLQIKDVLAKSQRNNAQNGLTGALVFTGGMFLQCLEGHRREVNTVYHRIAADPRHREPALLAFEEIEQRDFGAWSMGYLGYTKENRELFLKYSSKAEFDPYSMRAGALRGLFTELVASARAISNEV